MEIKKKRNAEKTAFFNLREKCRKLKDQNELLASVLEVALSARKPVYTITEVCEMFGVSRRHLQYLRDTKQIGYVQNGRKVLFRAEDLDLFFQANAIRKGGGDE